jgi:hypothetical protein
MCGNFKNGHAGYNKVEEENRQKVIEHIIYKMNQTEIKNDYCLNNNTNILNISSR